MDEREIKEDMHKRVESDSFGITSGSAAKSTSFSLKVYYRVEEEAKKKFEDTKLYKLLQLRTALQKAGIEI